MRNAHAEERPWSWRTVIRGHRGPVRMRPVVRARGEKKSLHRRLDIDDFRDCLEDGVQLVFGVYDLIGQTLVVDLIGAITDLLLEFSNPVMIDTVR